MVLIGIQPFAVKKVLLLALLILCLSSAICLADSLFMTVRVRSWGSPLGPGKPPGYPASEAHRPHGGGGH
jgi:hypothetical protein